MMIAWTRVHTIDALYMTRFVSNAHGSATCLEKMNYHGNIVPHGENERKARIYNVGRHNANALPPEYYNQGPLTRGPFTCQPTHCHVAPPGRPCGLPWPCHASVPPLCHLGTAWARAALRRGLACHVASARVPRATSARGLCGE